MYQSELITVNPEVVSGTPVFTGTRVPLKTMFDYMRGNHSLDDFLDDFPSVSREQARAVLRLAHDTLEAQVEPK